MAGYQHAELQCEVLTLKFDFKRKEAWLTFPEGNCCDMQGCTSMIERVYPDVETIHTQAGAWPDTAYVKVDGSWRALAWRDGQYVPVE